MLENLLNLVREHADDLIVRNTAIPNEHNDAAIADTTQSIAAGLQQAVAGGNVQSLLGLLGGQSNVQGHPIASQIISMVTQRLTNRSGVASQAASSVASNLVPQVLKQLISRTNNPADSSFDLNGILSALTGGKSNGIDLSQLVSSGASADSPGLASMIEQLRGGAQSTSLDIGSLATKVLGTLFRSNTQ